MWNNTDTPLAYLISFRSYGTWLSGNMPLDLSGFISCGPALTFGVGVSALPGDIGGSVSYTWNLARL